MRFSLDKPLNVYVNLIGATTPKYVFELLKLQFFFQGCGNRFLYVFQNSKLKTDYEENELFKTEQPQWMKEEIDEELLPFAETLFQASQKPFLFILSDEAKKRSTEFRNERERLKTSIKEDAIDSFKREYISRDWQKSLKLAQLRALSRNLRSKARMKTGIIDIDERDILWAQKIIRKCYRHFETIVYRWLGSATAETVKITQDVPRALRYLMVIKSYGIVSQPRLAVDVGNTSRNREFYDTISFLVDAGCVKVLKNMSSWIRQQGMGWMEQQLIDPNFKRPPVLYKFVRDLPLKEEKALEI